MSLLVILVINILVSIAYHQLGRPRIGIDDANIFFVYAKHLAEGEGFVYNRGGERVEGFTSFLWSLICAFAFRFIKSPEQFLLLCNILLLSATTVLVMASLFQFCKKNRYQGEKQGMVIAFGYLTLVFFFPGYLVWITLSLMDTGLWSFLLITTTLVILHMPTRLFARSRIGFAVLIGLLILTRPEAILWGIVFIASAFWQMWRVTNLKTAMKFSFAPIMTYVVTLTFLLVFRLTYFGYPFPNTYYAKVSPSFIYNVQQGFLYWSAYLKSNFLIALVLLVTIISAWIHGLTLFYGFFPQRTSWRNGDHVILSGVCLLGLLLPIAYGGDSFPEFRFYQVIFPLLTVNFLLFVVDINWGQLCNLPRYLHSSVVGGTLLVLLILAWQTSDVTWKNLGKSKQSLVGDFGLAEYSRKRGERLLHFFAELKKYPSVGVNFAGGIKFTYPGEVIDLLGLNNVKMGHSPGERKWYKNHAAFNKDIFYELMPDIIVYSNPKSVVSHKA